MSYDKSWAGTWRAILQNVGYYNQGERECAHIKAQQGTNWQSLYVRAYMKAHKRQKSCPYCGGSEKNKHGECRGCGYVV